MTRRKKTDGERIAAKLQSHVYVQNDASGLTPAVYIQEKEIARDIDRLIRKRMGEAWEEGWFDRDCHEADWNENPYRERTEK